MGATNPPLCNTHRVMFADVGRPPRPGQAVADVLGDLLSGQRVSRERLEQAAAEVLNGANWNLGGFMAGGYSPEIPHVPPTDRGPFKWPFGGFREHRQQQVDPQQLELLEVRRLSRVELGFAATEPITLEQLKSTHRKLVVAHHPDRAKNDVDRARRTEKMMRINAANDVLLDEIDPERAKRRDQG